MKGGLALLLSKGPPPKGGGPMPMKDDEAAESSPDSESAEGEGGDEQQYAKLVISAMKDGDDAGAADALVSLVKSCTGKSY